VPFEIAFDNPGQRDTGAMTVDQAKSFVQSTGSCSYRAKVRCPGTEAVAGEPIAVAGGVIRRLKESSRSFRQWSNHAMSGMSAVEAKGNLGSSPTLARPVRAARGSRKIVSRRCGRAHGIGTPCEQGGRFQMVPVEVRERRKGYERRRKHYAPWVHGPVPP